MKSDDTFNSAKSIQPHVLMAFFWGIAVVLWQTTGTISPHIAQRAVIAQINTMRQ